MEKSEFKVGDFVYFAVDRASARGHLQPAKYLPNFFVLGTQVSDVLQTERGVGYHAAGKMCTGFLQSSWNLRTTPEEAIADMVKRYPVTVGSDDTWITPDQVKVIMDIPDVGVSGVVRTEPDLTPIMDSIRYIIGEDAERGDDGGAAGC